MSEKPGLREQNKVRTRKVISDAAAKVFAARGFDGVTVADVAEEAGVSTKTVFNYFPRKEDLLFDRLPGALEQITRSVRERPEGTDPVSALRGAFVDLPRTGHPLSTSGDQQSRFWELVLASPVLQARAREIGDELERAIVGALAGAGESADELALRMTAAFVVAAYRTIYRAMADRLLAGEHPDKAAAYYAAQIERAFDAIERAALAAVGGERTGRP